MDYSEILTPETSGIVSASAGTGKTWLLVSRILRLLLAGRAPGSILAITFTNKAADEMRERLMTRLLQWSTAPADELDGHLRQIGIVGTAPRRRAAAQLYETLLYASEPVQMTTFHAFCQQMLRLFPLQAGVPLNFQIAEHVEELHDRAMDELFAQAARQSGGDFTRALDTLFALCNGIENTRQALKAFLAHRNDWLAFTRGGGGLEAFRDDGADEAGELKTLWRAGIRKRAAQYADALLRSDTKTNRSRGETLQTLAARTTLDDEAFDGLYHCFFTKDHKPRAVPGKNSPDWFVEALNSLDYDGLAGAVRAARERLLQHRNERLRVAWHHAGDRLCRIYRDLKRENGLLDFDDLEWEGSQLLLHGELHMQYRLGSKIEHLLVDEFQDTNPGQWQLLQPLLDEIVSQGGGSVFIVGDVKQSIYGFRRADPELQRAAARWLKEKCPGSLHLRMNTSRRSAQPLMDCVNRVFSAEPDAKQPLPDDSQTHNNAPSPRPANTAQPVPDDFQAHDTLRDIAGGVRLLGLREPGEKPSCNWRNPLHEPRPASQAASGREAAQVAAAIRQLAANGLPVEDGGRQRPLQYGDIIILARQTTHFGEFLQALRTEGVPSVSAHEQNFLTSLEAADIIALLEFLQNPRRDDALAVVLRSPIYSLSDEQLWQIARTPGDCWQRKLAQLAEENAEDAAAPQWRAIERQLASWITLRGQLPPHDLLDRIYGEAGLAQRYRRAVPEPESERVGDHLNALLEYALDFDSGRYPDTERFLHNLKTLRRLGGRRAATHAPTDSGCVRLMTIHGAKGLEAPVVFLADCAPTKRNKDTYQPLVQWPPGAGKPDQFALLPAKAGRGGALHSLVEQREQRERREDANLLYVALTRAKQYLFVSGSGKPGGNHWYARISDAIGEDGLLGDDALARTGKAPKPPAARAKDGKPAPLQTPSPHTKDGEPASPQPPTAHTKDGEPMMPQPPTAHTVDDEPAPQPPTSRLEGDKPPTAPRIAAARSPSQTATHAAATFSSDEDGARRGQIIHRALQLLNTSDFADSGALCDRLSQEYGADGESLAAWVREAWNLVRQPHLADLFTDTLYQRVHNEMPLLYRDGGEQVFGTLDRLCVGKDSAWLVDYKTHRNGDAETLGERYRGQMLCYRDGVKKLFPNRKLRTSLLLTANGQLHDY